MRQDVPGDGLRSPLASLVEATVPTLVSGSDAKGTRFTPATVDPELARRVAERYAARREALPFTPAAGKAVADRTVTVAVRLDDDSARAISIRSAIDSARSELSKSPGESFVTHSLGRKLPQ